MLTVGIPLKRGQRVKGTEMYRSDDNGATWRKISPDGQDVGGFLPITTSKFVWIRMMKTMSTFWEFAFGRQKMVVRTGEVHFNFGGDNHAMWIDPSDSEHIMLGYDHEWVYPMMPVKPGITLMSCLSHNFIKLT